MVLIQYFLICVISKAQHTLNITLSFNNTNPVTVLKIFKILNVQKEMPIF